MKKIIIFGGLAFGLFNVLSCTANKPNQSTGMDNKKTVSVSGIITHIENGKDGYIATIKDKTNKEYVGTISIINLQKSGSQFKRYEIGDTISVAGPFWKDEQGKTHITVEKLN